MKEIATIFYLNQYSSFLGYSSICIQRKIDAFESEDEGGNGLFLSLCICTVEKEQHLRAIIKTIPRNATYISPDTQNELIAAMRSVVVEGINHEIGNSWYAIKVYGTKAQLVQSTFPKLFVF